MLSEKLLSAGDKDVGLEAYEKLRVYTLQKHGLPEERLPFSDCVTVEYFGDFYGEETFSESESRDYKYVVYIHDGSGIVKRAFFNNIKEFDEACGELSAFFADKKKEKGSGGEKNRKERQLAELYQTINNLRELIGKEAKRAWEHVSVEDKGEIDLAGKPPNLSDNSLDKLGAAEVLFITGCLIRKVLEKGGVSPVETFRSKDGKTVFCEIGENCWSIKLKNRA